MATKDFCITFLSNELGLKPEELRAVAEHVDSVKQRAEASGKDFMTEYGRMVEEAKIAVKINEAKSALTLEKFTKREEELLQPAFKNDPVAGIEANFHTQNKKYKGEGNIYRTAAQVRNSAFRIISDGLRQVPGLHKRLKQGDKALTKQIYEGLHPAKGTTPKLDPGVDTIVKSIQRMNDHTLKLKNDAGFFVRKMPNYIIKQFHPPEKIRELGLDNFMALAKKTWDFDKIGVRESKIDQFLTEQYNRMSTRDIGSNVMTPAFTEVIKPKFVKAIEGSRSIHFKDGAAAFDYAEALGGGHNILDDIYKGVESDAKKIATAKQFGPNDNATFEMLLTSAKRQPGLSAKQLKRLQQKEAMLRDEFKLASGRDNRPEKNLLAKVGQVLRMLTDISKLKTALFSTVTDVSGTSGIMSGVNKTNFLYETASALDSMFRALPVKGKKEREWIAQQASVFMDDVLGFSNARFYEESGALGWFSKLHKRSMDFTGLPAQAHGMRVANARKASMRIADSIDKSFDNVPQRDALAKFGIGPKEWEIIRKSTVDVPLTPDSPKTVRMITPERITELSGSEDLGFKFGSYMEDIAEIGSPTPGLKQQVWKVSSDENTIYGQLDRFVMQYKSFITSQFDTMARIHNEGGWGVLAPTIVSYTTAGYMAMQMKQLAQGRTITPPENAEQAMNQFTQAFLQSGAGMLYSDFIFADFNQPWQSLPALVAGPALGGLLSDAASTWATIRGLPFAADRDKQSKKVGKQFMRLMEKNAPSFFLGQSYINKKIFESANEWLNPGSTYKKRKRLEKSNLKTIF